MIFVILTCIFCVVFVGSRVLFRRNIELFLCLAIAMYSEFFYLLPRIIGPEDYKLLLLPVIIVLVFEGLMTKKLTFGRYGWWVIIFLAISVVGVFVAWFSGQNILLGVKAAKFIPMVTVYFLLAGRRIQLDKFSTYFIIMGLIVATAALICFVTYGAINPFLGIERTELFNHLGKPRITAGQFVISVAAVMAFVRYKRKERIKFLFASAVLFGEVLFIQQTRGFIVTVFLSMVFVQLLYFKLSQLRFSLYMFLLVGLVYGWQSLSFADLSSFDLVQRSQADFTKQGGSYGGSAQARLNAYTYYWEQIELHPIIGRGMYNYNWVGNDERYLREYKAIYLSDIGITHFIVQAGLMGAIWIIFGLLKIWKDIWTFRNNLSVTCYFVIGTFTLPTLDMFLSQGTLFLFAIFLGLSSSMTVAANSVGSPRRNLNNGYINSHC